MNLWEPDDEGTIWLENKGGKRRTPPRDPRTGLFRKRKKARRGRRNPGPHVYGVAQALGGNRPKKKKARRSGGGGRRGGFLAGLIPDFRREGPQVGWALAGITGAQLLRTQAARFVPLPGRPVRDLASGKWLDSATGQPTLGGPVLYYVVRGAAAIAAAKVIGMIARSATAESAARFGALLDVGQEIAREFVYPMVPQLQLQAYLDKGYTAAYLEGGSVGRVPGAGLTLAPGYDPGEGGGSGVYAVPDRLNAAKRVLLV